METQYSPTKAAKTLSVSPQSVRKWIREGKFPNAFRKSDTKRSGWLIPQSDLDAFIERRQPKKEN